MGAWGLGPFDSDGALDFIDGIADRFHLRSEDGEDTTITVTDEARPLVAAVLRDRLTTVPTAAEWDLCEAYASIGLVAAAHSRAEEAAGTRLFASLGGGADGAGLCNHTGMAAVLDEATTTELLPLARTALEQLREREDWTSSWYGGQILLVLDEVAAALAAA